MITRANFAQKTQESGILTNKEFKETYEELSAFTDGFTRWDHMDDVPELQDVYDDFVVVLEKVIAKNQAAADASRSDEPTRAPKFQPGDKVKRLKGLEKYPDAYGEIMDEGNWQSRFGQAGYVYRVQWSHTRAGEANAPENVLELYLGQSNASNKVLKFKVGDLVKMADKSPTGYEFPNGGQMGKIVKVKPEPAANMDSSFDYLVQFVGPGLPRQINEENLVSVSTPTHLPKFKAGDRVVNTGKAEWGQGNVLSHGSRVGEVYWYVVRWEGNAPNGNSKESDLALAPEPTTQETASGGKKTKGSSKKIKTAKPEKPAAKSKPKFKVGQYALMGTQVFEILEVRYAPVADGHDHKVGWHYRTNEFGSWVHEDSIHPSTKRQYGIQETDENYFGSKQKVFATPEEVRHMKRFIANAASSTKDGLTKAYKALQRAITSGKIRKTSSYANTIMLMQKEYHAALGNGAPYKVKPNDFDLSGMVKAVGGPTVYRSVKAMNYLVSKMGKTLDKKAIDAAIKYITGLRVPGADPFSIQVLDAVQMLRKASSSGGSLDVANADALDLQGLNGLSALMGLAHKCGCDGAGHSLSGLGNLPVASPQMAVGPGRRSGVKDTMTSHELENLSYTTLPLKGKWAELIGSPQTNFTMMVWGSPGAGKSTLMMQFSRYLAENHGNVLYVSSEEFPSYTLKTKLNLVGGAAHGWEFSKSLNSLRADHKFLVIDSTNHYRFTTADLKALMARRPDLSILLVVQITKGGNFKGDQSIEHEVDAVVKVTQEGATTIKNRFQPLSTVPVFDDSYSLIPQSNQPNVNQNRPTFY